MPQEVYPAESSSSPQGTGGRRDGAGSGKEESAADALRMVWVRLAELRASAAYFLAAKLDRLKLTIRQYVVLAVVGVLGLVAAAGAVVTAVVLTLQGIAGALAALCDHTRWLGDLLCGVLVLGAMAIFLRVAVAHITKTSRESTIHKYESDERKERINLDLSPNGPPAGEVRH